MSENNGVEEISGNHFNEFIKEDLVVIDFWASWCMPCVTMTPIIEETAEKFKKIKFAKVNVDENSKLAQKFKIMSIPTMIIFKKGKEVERLTGSMPAVVLEEKLNSHLK